jgi:hypothetical protein
MLDSDVALKGYGGRARPDHVCFISSRILSAKFMDFSAISTFSKVFYINVPPPLNESF